MAEPNSSLQFDRAEFEGNTAGPAACTSCGQALQDVYYEVGGAVACDACRRRLESEASAASDFGSRVVRFLRSAAFGTLAGIAGWAIYCGVFVLTDGWQVGLISILVGIMVGNAVRIGARGRGGWLYQALAMFVTYTAIVFSYVPALLKESQGPWAEVQQQGMLAVIITALVAVPVLYVLPFLMVAQDASSLLSVLIIAFGVYEAWRLNKKGTLQITGPYRLATPPGTLQT